MQELHRIFVNAVFCSRYCLKLFHHSETEVFIRTVVGLSTAAFKPLVLLRMTSSLASYTYIEFR
jgi:hypothetical protein